MRRNVTPLSLGWFAGWALMQASTLWAADWDARTTLTNTVINGADVQRALNAGLTPAFVQRFPVERFGIHVQVDRHQLKELPQEVVYVGLGLSDREPNGDYRLAEGYYTTMVVLPKAATAEQQRQSVGQRLQSMAGEFSRLMIQYQSGRANGAKRAAPSSPHWSQWPDYRPGR